MEFLYAWFLCLPLLKASLQRHLEKLPSVENGDEICSSEGEMSDDTDGSANQYIEANEIMEKVFSGYDLKGFSFPPPSAATKGMNDASANGIGR